MTTSHARARAAERKISERNTRTVILRAQVKDRLKIVGSDFFRRCLLDTQCKTENLMQSIYKPRILDLVRIFRYAVEEVLDCIDTIENEQVAEWVMEK